MNLKKYKDSHGNYYEFNELNKSLTTIIIHGVGLDNTMSYPQKSYFQNKSVIFSQDRINILRQYHFNYLLIPLVSFFQCDRFSCFLEKKLTNGTVKKFQKMRLNLKFELQKGLKFEQGALNLEMLSKL